MSVDPNSQVIPQAVIRSGDRELIDWYEFDARWKHDMWQQLVGPQSETDPVTVTYSYYAITGNRTTNGYEFIRASDELTITLNSSPSAYENVVVQPVVDRPITVAGTINNQSSVVIHKSYDMVSFTYYDQFAEWVVG